MNANTRPRFFIPFPAGTRVSLKSYRGHNPDDKKIDIYAVNWPNVIASAPGVVHQTFAPGGCEIRHYIPGSKQLGNWYTVYLHMSNVVARGTVVQQGDRVGTPSNVGTGAKHLHYEQLHDTKGRGDAQTSDMVRPAFVEYNNGNPFAMPVGEPGLTVVSQNRKGAEVADLVNMTRKQLEDLIDRRARNVARNGLRALISGKNWGWWTGKTVPGIRNMNVRSRLEALEKKVK